MNDNEVKVYWKGKAVGDEIRFKREMAGQPDSAGEIVAGRAK